MYTNGMPLDKLGTIRRAVSWRFMGEFVSAGGHEQADGLSARRMAPEVGFEPTTNRLTADRSTTELLWIVSPAD